MNKEEEKNLMNETFHYFNIALNDFKKLLNATDSKGNAANFAQATIAFIITEPMAKVYAPFLEKKKNKSGRYKLATLNDEFRDISTYYSLKLFFKECFSNKRYFDLYDFLWKIYRNGLVHTYSPRKILQIPNRFIDNSALTGVHYSGSLADLEIDYTLKQKSEAEHLKFYIHGYGKNDVPRPVFRFIPSVYYKDLFRSYIEFQDKVLKTKNIRKRFLVGASLLGKEKRIKYSDFRRESRVLIRNELKKLVNF